MRERRTNIQLTRDIIKQLMDHGELSIAELANLLRSNSLVISRWMEIFKLIQVIPRINRSENILSINNEKIKVSIYSSRRKSKITSEFEILQSTSYDIKEFYTSIFKIVENGEIILIDPEQDVEALPPVVHLNTKPNGELPITHWQVLKIYSKFKDISNSLDLLNFLKFYPNNSLMAQEGLSEIVEQMDIQSEYSIEDPRFWTNLSSEQCKLLLRNPRTSLFISRVNFLSNRKEVFDGIDYSKLPAESQFWLYLVIIDHQLKDKVVNIENLLKKLDYRYTLIYQLFVHNKVLDNEPNTSRTSASPNSIWEILLFYFIDQVRDLKDPFEILGVYIAFYHNVDSAIFPFMSYWLIRQIVQLVQRLCFPHPQISWLNVLKSSTLRTFGYGEQYLRVSGNLIRNAFRTENYKFVSIFAKTLIENYDLAEYYLYDDDINFLYLMSSLDTSSIKFRRESPYRFDFLTGTLLKTSANFREPIDNLSGTKWILGHHERKNLMYLIEISEEILREKGRKKLQKFIRSSNLADIQKIYLALLTIKLPEFGISNKKYYTKTILDIAEVEGIESDLLFVRLLLDKWMELKNVTKFSKRIRKRLEYIIRNDPSLENTWNLEFVFCTSVLVKMISKEDKWKKSSLLKLIEKLDYRKNLSKNLVSSPSARYSIYQRMIPRKGRKPQTQTQYFTDIKLDLAAHTIYTVLLCRDMFVNSLQ